MLVCGSIVQNLLGSNFFLNLHYAIRSQRKVTLHVERWDRLITFIEDAAAKNVVVFELLRIANLGADALLFPHRVFALLPAIKSSVRELGTPIQ